MGTIARFDLSGLARRYGVVHFVETGAGAGDSLAHAAAVVDPPFETLTSCEVEPSLAANVAAKFADDGRVAVWAYASDKLLPLVCGAYREPILFWLDAHFPGADYGLKAYDAEADETVRLPLERELALIAKLRPEGHDVVICDDLRIYMDGPFQHHNLPPDLRPLCPAERSVQFAYDIMGATHDIRPLFEHEGYLMMTPKEARRDA